MPEKYVYMPKDIAECQQNGTAVEGEYPEVDHVYVHDYDTGEKKQVMVSSVVVKNGGLPHTIFEERS